MTKHALNNKSNSKLKKFQFIFVTQDMFSNNKLTNSTAPEHTGSSPYSQKPATGPHS
jgi:hypothetical protein